MASKRLRSITIADAVAIDGDSEAALPASGQREMLVSVLNTSTGTTDVTILGKFEQADTFQSILTAAQVTLLINGGDAIIVVPYVPLIQVNVAQYDDGAVTVKALIIGA